MTDAGLADRIAQWMLQHHRIEPMALEIARVLIDLLETGVIMLGGGALASRCPSRVDELHPPGEEYRLSNTSRRSLVETRVPDDHAGRDGVQMWRLLDRGRQLGDSRPRPIGHADLAIRPRLGGNEFDRVPAILAISVRGEIKLALGTSCAARIDANDGIAMLQESLVQ